MPVLPSVVGLAVSSPVARRALVGPHRLEAAGERSGLGRLHIDGAEDVAHLVLGLAVDIGSDVVTDHTHDIEESGEVVTESGNWDEVRNQVCRYDQVGQCSDDLHLGIVGRSWRHHHVVEQQRVVHELRAHLGGTLGQLAPEAVVRVLVTVVAKVARGTSDIESGMRLTLYYREVSK